MGQLQTFGEPKRMSAPPPESGHRKGTPSRPLWARADLASYHQRVSEDGRLVRYTVKPERMFFVEPAA